MSRHTIIAVFFLVLSMMIFNFRIGAEATEDITEGLLGIEWGIDVSGIDGLIQKSEQEDIHYYTKPGSRQKIDHFVFDEILLAFYQGRFFAAHAEFSSNDTAKVLRDYFTDRFGNPRAQLRIDQTIYIWEHRDLKIKIKESAKTDNHKLSYYFIPISAKVNETRIEEGFESVFALPR